MWDIPEKDWKYLRSLEPILLDRLCRRILGRIEAKIEQGGGEGKAHETYLAVFRLVQRSDRTVGKCFDDWRRSNVFQKLLALIHENLITDEELAPLSDETGQRVRAWRECVGGTGLPRRRVPPTDSGDH